MMKILSVLVVIALGLPGRMAGQNEGNAGAVLELPSDARAMALGNAYVWSGGGPDGVFYNPALTSGGGFSVGFLRFGSSATMLTAASASGSFGVGIQALTFGAGSPDLLANPIALGDLTSNGSTAVAELVGTVSYGNELFGFQIGLAAKWLEQRVGAARDGVPLVDVGVVREVGPLAFAAALQNVGPDLSIGPLELPAPYRAGVGVATDVEQLGPLDVALAAAIFRQHDGGVMAGGGVEVSYWPIVGRTFTARFGVVHEPHTGTVHLTLGGAVRLDGFAANYAFQDLSAPGSIHGASFGWR